MTLRCTLLWLRQVYFLGAEESMVLTEKLLGKTPQAPLMTLPELPFMASRQQHTVQTVQVQRDICKHLQYCWLSSIIMIEWL